MHMLIIAQYLNLFEPGEDRLLKLGRSLVESGNNVTIITGSSEKEMNLSRKMIGLTEENGINIVSLSIPYDAAMDNKKKLSAFMRFKKLSEHQGRQLPRPDLILALSPPLTALMPALSLSSYYKVPLAIEIRELWPDAPIQRGTLRNFILVRIARRFEEKVYEKADIIIAGGKGIADAIKERWVERAKITLLPPQMNDENEMINIYQAAISGVFRTNSTTSARKGNTASRDKKEYNNNSSLFNSNINS